MRALDRKDAAGVSRHGGPIARTLNDLLLGAGPAARALAVLGEAALPPASRLLTQRLSRSVEAIAAAAPGLRLTIDPIEFRGWRYHTGLCVSVYAPGRHEELGRGGRYLTGGLAGAQAGGEPACGLTLRPEAILRAAPARPIRPRLFIPRAYDDAAAASLRAQGFATVASLRAVEDDQAEAIRLGCTHYLRHDRPVRLATDTRS